MPIIGILASAISGNLGLSVDYLVVAGGGGGGYALAGGGGAGGLRSTVTATGGGGSLESPLTLALDTLYTVTVGAGGAGDQVVAWFIKHGNNSVFSTITSTGGGKAVVVSLQNGSSNRWFRWWWCGNLRITGGAGTANQGFAGGNGALLSLGGAARWWWRWCWCCWW
jgi:hypothetical protein